MVIFSSHYSPLCSGFIPLKQGLSTTVRLRTTISARVFWVTQLWPSWILLFCVRAGYLTGWHDYCCVFFCLFKAYLQDTLALRPCPANISLTKPVLLVSDYPPCQAEIINERMDLSDSSLEITVAGSAASVTLERKTV